MKKLIILLLSVFATIATVQAQEISVKSMEQLSMDLSARINARKDFNGQNCALVKVQIPVDDVVFDGNVVGTVEHQVNEYLVYMTAGSKTLDIRHPRYHTLSINFADHGIASLEQLVTYRLILNAEQLQERVVVYDTVVIKTNEEVDVAVTPVTPAPAPETVVQQPVVAPAPVAMVHRPLSVYIGGSYQLGTAAGIHASLGAFIKGFNVEASMLLGLAESEEIFALSSDATLSSYSYTYKTTGFGVRLGYAFPVGDSFRITPQVGAGLASIKGTQQKSGSGQNPEATDAYAVSGNVGLRLDYLIANNFGISLTPDFGFALSESDLYTRLSGASATVKGFGQGFNLRAGIFVCF